jgi:maltooligosyltrehalose trehalohydrolase
MLFQGEEWGTSAPFQYFTNHSDPELGCAVSTGRCEEFAAFGWAPENIPDPQDPETFRRSKLKWREISDEPHREMLSWYGSLIQFRRQHPALALPEVRVHFSEAEKWLIMERPGISVVCNFSQSVIHMPVASGGPVLLRWPLREMSSAEQVLPPGSVLVVKNTAPSDNSPEPQKLETVPADR